MIKVSVIIPLHNSEKYISECIESILQQTLSEIELICIDSSTDGTREILKEYQKKDARIRILEDENSSYGHKLNIGIQRAEGSYVSVVESDDYIEKGMLGALYEIAARNRVDFVKSDYRKFFNGKEARNFKEITRFQLSDYNRIINLKEESEKRFSAYLGIWTGLYNREFLLKNEIRLNESPGASYQDTGFSILVCLLAENVWFTSEFYYNYRIDNVGSSVKSNEKCGIIADEYAWIERQMRQRGLEGTEEKKFFADTKLASYFWNYRRLPEVYRNYFIDIVKDEIRSEYLEKKDISYSKSIKEQIAILSGDRTVGEQYRQKEKYFKDCSRKIAELLGSKREVVVFGAGDYGKSLAAYSEGQNRKNIRAVCDNDESKQGSSLSGIKIISLEQGVREYPDAEYIIANRNDAQEMRKQLNSKGIKEQQIYEMSGELDGIALFEQMAGRI